MGIEAIAGLLTNLGMTAQTANTVATGVNVITGPIGQGMEFLGLGGALDKGHQFFQGLTGGSTPPVITQTPTGVPISTGATPATTAHNIGAAALKGGKALGSGVETVLGGAKAVQPAVTMGLGLKGALAKGPKIPKSRMGRTALAEQQLQENRQRSRAQASRSRFAPSERRPGSRRTGGTNTGRLS